MSTAAEIAHAFSAKQSGNGWIAHCPLHNDHTESFSIGEGSTGKVLLHCFAGCSQGALVAEVRRRGYEPDGILGSKPRAKKAQRGSKKPGGSNRLINIGRKKELDEEPPREPPPDDEPEEEPDEEASPLGHNGRPPLDEASPEPGLRQPARCDLETYAKKLKLAPDHLKDAGLSDGKFAGAPAIKIPYLDESGQVVSTRYRIRMTAKDRFRWNKGEKTCLFGLNRIAEAREKGVITIVEGESDCLTLWWENFDAVGIPGATNWQEERDARHLDGFEKIYVVIESDAGGEPDAGGKAVLKWLAESSIRDRAHLVFMPAGTKDPAALYQSNTLDFVVAWPRLLEQAQPWQAYADAGQIEERNAAKKMAARLLSHPNVLDEVCKTCHKLGVIHETILVQLTYLTATTRILDKVVSIIVKGPSSTGKSYVVGKVMGMFPPDAYYAWSSVSERALIYKDEPLSHRMIVFYEAAGIANEFLAYTIRTLLSEDRLVYETLEKVGGKIVSRTIVKEGPTGLILTTTKLSIDSETETRCISITATDTPAQTAAIMLGQAKRANQMAVKHDLSEFHALQTFLALDRAAVVVPFAEALAALIKPVTIRLRRDHDTLLSLIKAHALLHQGNRDRNEDGAIIATYVDYSRVSRLLNGLISDAAGITVPATVRETRQVVADLLAGDVDEPEEGERRRFVRKAPKETDAVSVREIATALGLGHPAAWRRVQDATKRGYLKNLEEKKGRPARIALGDPIAADERLLPLTSAIKAAMETPS